MIAEPLTLKEKQFVELLLPYISLSGTFRFGPLRKAGIPEKTEEIFKSGSEWLDSQVSRKFQILRDKGWLTMEDGVYTLLHRP
jgi:hypothetical protein